MSLENFMAKLEEMIVGRERLIQQAQRAIMQAQYAIDEMKFLGLHPEIYQDLERERDNLYQVIERLKNKT